MFQAYRSSNVAVVEHVDVIISQLPGPLQRSGTLPLLFSIVSSGSRVLETASTMISRAKRHLPMMVCFQQMHVGALQNWHLKHNTLYSNATQCLQMCTCSADEPDAAMGSSSISGLGAAP